MGGARQCTIWARQLSRSSRATLALSALVLGCSSTDVLGTREFVAADRSPERPRGELPNLLEERQAVPLTQVKAQLNAAFLQLFFGDPETEAVFRDLGNGTGYIEDINNSDVRTDSMGYGLLVTVALDQREIFDQLWSWTKEHMMFQSGASRGLLRWRCDTDGANCADAAATDSSSVIATALFIASRRWTTGTAHDYRADGLSLLEAMTESEERSSAASEGVVNCFDFSASLPRLSSKSPDEEVPLDYLMPAFYAVWAEFDVERAESWERMAARSREILGQAANPDTGLLPEWVTYEGAPVPLRGDYRLTTSRVFLNEALDHLWYEATPAILEGNARLLDFFLEEGIGTYAAEYTSEGRPLVAYNTVGHRSLVALAAGMTSEAKYNVFLEDLMEQPIPTGTFRYYEGMLYMLSLLTLSGQMTPP
jgi:oligosaccharide reducing-end xylanase